MIYVSRVLSRSRVCVTDTEDGVEEVLTGNELVKCLRDFKIDIKGASLVHKNGRYSVAVEVYQPQDTISTFQVKQKLLRGIDVRVSNDKITCIQWSKKLPAPVSIRLSDYGTSCADYLFWWKGLCETSDVTLVFDDKIKVTSKSFKYLSILGVKSDLTEVTNEKLVRTIYKAYAETYKGRFLRGENYPTVITDNLERLKFWQAVYFLNNGQAGLTKTVKSIFQFPGVVEAVSKEYSVEFKSLCKCPFTLVQTSDRYWKCRLYLRAVYEVWDDYDFETLRSRCASQLFSILEEYSTYNRGSIIRFRNYINFVDDVPEDIQEAFVEFCVMVNDQISQEG